MISIDYYRAALTLATRLRQPLIRNLLLCRSPILLFKWGKLGRKLSCIAFFASCPVLH